MSDSEKPETALEAVEAASAEPAGDVAAAPADSSSADEQELSPPEEDTEAASIEPSSEGPASEEGQRGPIPYDRHKAVLTKQRGEAEVAAKAFEDYRTRVAWAEQVDQGQYQQQQQLLQELNSNPIDFLRKLQREIEAHPHLGPQLQQPAAFQMPEPFLQSQDGKPVYTAEQAQQIRDHDQATFEARLAEQAQTLGARQDRLEQVEQQRMAVSQAAQTSAGIMTQMRQDPTFVKYEKDVQEAFAAMPNRHREIGVQGALLEAYQQVIRTKVLPSLKKESKTETLNTLQKKAAAGTVNPSSGAAMASTRPRNQKELAKLMEERETR